MFTAVCTYKLIELWAMETVENVMWCDIVDDDI